MELARRTIEHDEDFLRQISTPIDFEKDNVKGIIESLREYCSNNAVYAMAPVQIGIPKRLIYLKNTNENMNNNFDKQYDESTILINPIIKEAKGHTRFLEGCESCTDGLDNHGTTIFLAGLIDRPYSVTIEYYDENNSLRTEEFTGFKATVFMHEYDHLDGILHLDKAREILRLNLEQMRMYRTYHPQEVIDKDEPFKTAPKKK